MSILERLIKGSWLNQQSRCCQLTYFRRFQEHVGSDATRLYTKTRYSSNRGDQSYCDGTRVKSEVYGGNETILDIKRSNEYGKTTIWTRRNELEITISWIILENWQLEKRWSNTFSLDNYRNIS